MVVVGCCWLLLVVVACWWWWWWWLIEADFFNDFREIESKPPAGNHTLKSTHFDGIHGMP